MLPNNSYCLTIATSDNIFAPRKVSATKYHRCKKLMKSFVLESAKRDNYQKVSKKWANVLN